MKESERLMEKKMEEYIHALERLRLAEYVRYLDDRRKMIRHHLLLGMLRGVGMAVGFTILSALLVVVLKRLAEQNLPLIGDFLAQMVKLVQRRLE